MNYQVISLAKMIEALGESEVCKELSSFSSPINTEVEDFLKNTALEFTRQNIAPTNLVYAQYNGSSLLCGYFTLTIKTFEVEKGSISSQTFNKVKKFGTYDNDSKKCTVPAPLIAQLGKNFTDNNDRLISGSELLEMACNEVKKAQCIIGGKAVCLECEDTQKLKDFYVTNKFKEFSRRPLKSVQQGQYLIQMLKYLD